MDLLRKFARPRGGSSHSEIEGSASGNGSGATLPDVQAAIENVGQRASALGEQLHDLSTRVNGLEAPLGR